MKRVAMVSLIISTFVTFNASAFVGSVTGVFNCVAPSSKYGQINIKIKANGSDEALEKAANICFQKLTENSHAGISEDDGLEIIDVCANLNCN